MSTLYLIRHADAGDRIGGDDRLRSLTIAGQEQARALAESFARTTVTRVISSPSLRCIGTVAPMALLRGLSIEIDDRLHEDADPVAAAEFLLTVDGDWIIGSHGEPLGSVIRQFVQRGAECSDPLRVQKASTWVATVDAGVPSEVHYLAPPGSF